MLSCGGVGCLTRRRGDAEPRREALPRFLGGVEGSAAALPRGFSMVAEAARRRAKL